MVSSGHKKQDFFLLSQNEVDVTIFQWLVVAGVNREGILTVRRVVKNRPSRGS